MSEMVHITINKQPLEVPAGTRIIEAAKMLNIEDRKSTRLNSSHLV